MNGHAASFGNMFPRLSASVSVGIMMLLLFPCHDSRREPVLDYCQETFLSILSDKLMANGQTTRIASDHDSSFPSFAATRGVSLVLDYRQETSSLLIITLFVVMIFFSHCGIVHR